MAGTAAKCPKCKTKFVVPAPDGDENPKADEPLVSKEPATPSSEPNDKPLVAAESASVAETPAQGPSADDDVHEETSTALPVTSSETVGIKSPEQGTETLALPEDSPFEDEPVVPARHASAELALPDDDSPLPAPKSAPTAEFSKPVTSFDQPLSLGDSDDDLDAMPQVTLQKKPSTSDRDVFSDDDDDSPSLMMGGLSSTTNPKSSSDRSRESEPPKIAEKKPKSSKSSAEMAPFDPLKYLMDSPAQNSDTFSTGPESDADLTLDDFDEAAEPSDRGRPISKPKSSATMSTRQTPEKVDLATAAKMMKKAIKESQAEAAQQRERDAEAGFDYGQFFREFGMRGVIVLVGGIAGIFLCYLLSNYFWSSGMRLPKMGYVSGVAKLDGKPLVGAIIYYAPEETALEGTKREKARTSMGMTDEQGRFTMMYLPEKRIQGVAAGKCRVWVEHMGPNGNDIPRAWMQNAMRPAVVKAGSQVDDINMDSDPPDPRKAKK